MTETPAPHGAAPEEARLDGDNQAKETPPPKAETPSHILTGWWRDFVRAANFLTRIPFRIDEAEAARPLASAARGFPIAGLVVGVCGAIVLMLANYLGLPQLASALLAVASTALVAGGLHEEGLANTVDGLLGAKNRDDVLRMMRESNLGAFGMLALVFIVGLKVAALEAIEPGEAAASLIAAEVAGRTVLPVVLLLLPPARTEGLSLEAGRPRKEDITLTLLLGGALILLMLGITTGIVTIVLAAVTTAMAIKVARARLGGHTGDILGATEQVTATAVLLAAAAVV